MPNDGKPLPMATASYTQPGQVLMAPRHMPQPAIRPICTCGRPLNRRKQHPPHPALRRFPSQAVMPMATPIALDSSAYPTYPGPIAYADTSNGGTSYATGGAAQTPMAQAPTPMVQAQATMMQPQMAQPMTAQPIPMAQVPQQARTAGVGRPTVCVPRVGGGRPAGCEPGHAHPRALHG